MLERVKLNHKTKALKSRQQCSCDALPQRAHMTNSLIFKPVLIIVYKQAKIKWNPAVYRQFKREVCALVKKGNAIWHYHSFFLEHYQKKKKKKWRVKKSIIFQLESVPQWPWLCCSSELLNDLLFHSTFLHTLRILPIDRPFTTHSFN